MFRSKLTSLSFPTLHLGEEVLPGGSGKDPEPVSLPIRISSNLPEPEFTQIELHKIDQSQIKDTYHKFNPYLYSARDGFRKDKRLRKNYFYKIKLTRDAGPSDELFGRLKDVNPEDVEIGNVKNFQIFVPTLTKPPVQISVRGDFIDQSQINSIEAALIQDPFYLAKGEKSIFVDKEPLFHEKGFKPIYVEDGDPYQSMPRSGSSHVPWIMVISSAWMAGLSAEKQETALSKLDSWYKQSNHLIINCRNLIHPVEGSGSKTHADFDLNKRFNCIPPQWASYSFYDAFDIDSVLGIISEGFSKKIFNLALNDLLK